jgi:hypothetical protein
MAGIMSQNRSTLTGANCAMLGGLSARPQANSTKQTLSKWYFFSTAGVLGLLGLVLLLAAFDGELWENEKLLRQSDAVFGISTRLVLLVAVALHFGLAGFLIFSRDVVARLLVSVWMLGVCVTYVFGLSSLTPGPSSPVPVSVLVSHKIGVSLKLLGIGWALFVGFVGVGAAAQCEPELLCKPFQKVIDFMAQWRERAAHKAELAAGFLKVSCPSCGGHIKFSIQNLGQKMPCPHCQTNITLRKPENLKVSCYFCKGHIEFPAHAIGQKLKCPHCHMDIGLKEPA